VDVVIIAVLLEKPAAMMVEWGNDGKAKAPSASGHLLY
jgi:hypothetical protein